VPVVSITGTNGKTTTTRLVAHISMTAGLKTAWSSTSGVVVMGKTIDAGDFSRPAGARELLATPGLELGVLVTARGGMLLRGMGVAVNGEDPCVWAMRNRIHARPWAFSLDPDAPALRESVAAGGRGITVLDGEIVVLRPGTDPDRLVRIVDVPETLSGPLSTTHPPGLVTVVTMALTSATWSRVSMPWRPRWSAVTLVTTLTSKTVSGLAKKTSVNVVLRV